MKERSKEAEIMPSDESGALFQVGDRVRDAYGAPGIVREVGIRMRDSRDRVRDTLKIDLQAHEGKPPIPGAYRFVETVRKEND